MEDLFVLGFEHGDHFPVLVPFLLGLGFCPPTLILQVGRLIFSAAQFSCTLFETALGLLHKATVLVLFEINGSNIILDLAPEL